MNRKGKGKGRGGKKRKERKGGERRETGQGKGAYQDEGPPNQNPEYATDRASALTTTGVS